MSDLDRYFDTYGRQLHSARPRPPRRALALTASGALAVPAVAAALLIGGGSAPVNAIAEARAALTVQKGQIVALRMRVELPGTSATIEQWTATDPRRWRSVRIIDGNRMEAAWGPGAQSWLTNGRLQIQEGVREDDNFGSLPIGLGFDGTDPENDIQAMLAAGRLTDQGEIEVDGRKVRRLVGGGLTYDRPGDLRSAPRLAAGPRAVVHGRALREAAARRRDGEVADDNAAAGHEDRARHGRGVANRAGYGEVS